MLAYGISLPPEIANRGKIQGWRVLGTRIVVNHDECAAASGREPLLVSAEQTPLSLCLPALHGMLQVARRRGSRGLRNYRDRLFSWNGRA